MDKSPPTLRDVLRQNGTWLWVQRPQCGCDKAIPLAPFIARYGLDAPLSVVLKKSRCTTCGERPATISIPSWPGVGKKQAPIPLDRVPGTLRDWAKVDLTHTPAPLRGMQ
jgi:hypothetical protein